MSQHQNSTLTLIWYYQIHSTVNCTGDKESKSTLGHIKYFVNFSIFVAHKCIQKSNETRILIANAFHFIKYRKLFINIDNHNVKSTQGSTQSPTAMQNLHWKLGLQTPSDGTLLAYLETTV